MNHAFDIDLAEEVGVEAAIIFANIQHWCLTNAANGQNIHEGRSWMYNSRSAWCELFPYLGEKQIRNALERLVNAELVLRAQFSAGSVNRTYWYGLAERAKAFGRKGQTSGRKGQTNTIIGTVINTPSTPTPTKAPKRAHSRIRLSQFLEDNHTIDLGWHEWAKQQFGWDDARTYFEMDDFRDYWESGNAAGGGLKADWPATWRGHCRRISGIKGRGPRAAGGGTGQGGFKRHDHVAAATSRALDELFPDRPKGHAGASPAADTSPCPFGDGEDTIDAVFVDVGQGVDARQHPAGGTGRGDTHCNGRTPLPLEVE